MRTDTDDPACVRDPAIELLLSHTATLTDEWCSRRRSRRQLGLGIGEIRPAAMLAVHSPSGRTPHRRGSIGSDRSSPLRESAMSITPSATTSEPRHAPLRSAKPIHPSHPRHVLRASPTPRLRRLLDRHHRLPLSGSYPKAGPGRAEARSPWTSRRRRGGGREIGCAPDSAGSIGPDATTRNVVAPMRDGQAS
jgi:hypothetical protein